MNWILCIICLIVIIGIIVTRFEIIVASGRSMLPTVKDGDWLLVYKPLNKFHVKEGSIYVLELKLPNYNELVVKRITKSYETNSTIKVWLLGDNPQESYDSRYYGYVSSKFIVGRVIKIWQRKK